MDPFVLLAYANLAASRTLLQQLLACLNLTLNLNQKNYSVGTNKKVISMNYDSSTSSWKPWRWRRLGLILKVRGIYINSNLNLLTKFTSRSRSTEFKDVLPWNIFQITKTIPIRMRIAISYSMKWAIPFWLWWKVNGNWQQQNDQNFPLKGKPL